MTIFFRLSWLSIENPYKLNNIRNSSNIYTHEVKPSYFVYLHWYPFTYSEAVLETLSDDDLTQILDALVWMDIQDLKSLVENEVISRISSDNFIRYFLSNHEMIYVILLQIHPYMSKIQLRRSKNKMFEYGDAKSTVL